MTKRDDRITVGCNTCTEIMLNISEFLNENGYNAGWYQRLGLPELLLIFGIGDQRRYEINLHYVRKRNIYIMNIRDNFHWFVEKADPDQAYNLLTSVAKDYIKERLEEKKEYEALNLKGEK